MKIVIVEDEIRIREGLTKLISKLDDKYEVVGQAENGQTGLALICRENPDIIITDIKMPVMDGLQMLEEIQKKGLQIKTIVLSAYSEFEYARGAMRMGVKEYLVKPIAVTDVSESLRRVTEEIFQEKRRSDAEFGSIEKIFGGIFFGTIEADDTMRQRLKEHFAISEDTSYDLICLYLGQRYESEKQKAKRELNQLLTGRKRMKYILLEMDRKKTVVVLAYEDQESISLERWVQYWLLQNRSRETKGVVGFISDLQLDEIKGGLKTLLAYMDWNISFGDDVLISYPKITRLQTSPCIYPLEIENKMKMAVCTGDKEKIQKSLLDFREYFSNGKVYFPGEIKECCVRFFLALINTGKEVGILDYEKLKLQYLLEQVMGAKMMEELDSVSTELLERLAVKDSQNDAVHLTVKRAQGMIQEFYQNGVTLEEIAAKLGITPEYLGTRFHQEVGMTFSAYIKDFRMKKAKELLIGTNLKLYEIAEKTGYSDPKYFSRVFKETTGMLPAEYRKIHK